MKIKKLYLTSFGKFYKKDIELSDGFNLIKGLNEAGKSTIHKFIEGMLFGFYKTGGKNRSLNEFHQLYMPRSKSEYLGSMLVEFKGIEYFIERDFKKTNPLVKITDNKTGKDLTDKIPYNNATRLPDVAAFLEIDYTMYSNTISVTQMESETGKDLASVVTEKLTNLNTTKDESISLAKVNSALDSKIENIGTKKSKTKPLFLTIQKVLELERELEKSEEAYKEVSSFQRRINVLEDELKKTEESLNILDSQKSIYENEKLKVLYNKVESLIIEKDAISNTASKLEMYKSLSKTDYDKSIILELKLDEANKQKVKLENELVTLGKNIKTLDTSITKNSYLSMNNVKYMDIYEEYVEFRSIEKEIINITEEQNRISNTKKNDINLSELKSDYIKYRENNKIDYNVRINEISDDITLLENERESLNEKFPSKFNRILSFILIFTIVFSFVRVIQNKKIKRQNLEIYNINNKLITLQESYDEINTKNQEQTALIGELQSKYKVKTDIEFDILYQENSSKAHMEEVNKIRINEIKEELHKKEKRLNLLNSSLKQTFMSIMDSDNITSDNLQTIKNIIDKNDVEVEERKRSEKRIVILEKELSILIQMCDNLNKDILLIFNNNKVGNINEFKDGLIEKNKYDECLVKMSTLDIRIEDYLGKLSFDELKSKINFDNSIDFNEEIYVTLVAKESSLRDEVLKANTEKSSIIEKVSYIENDNRDLSLITNEINFYSEKLNEMENSLKAIGLVKKILDELSSEISYEFAPALNDEVSKVIKKVTNGRYDDVKLDRNLDVKMFDSASNKIESVKGFSKGTIDQVYLAMRFGINKVVSENTNPFILDDAFVNYDGQRLKQVISIIAEDSKEEDRQVILFSCQEREAELLKELKLGANVITI